MTAQELAQKITEKNWNVVEINCIRSVVFEAGDNGRKFMAITNDGSFSIARASLEENDYHRVWKLGWNHKEGKSFRTISNFVKKFA